MDRKFQDNFACLVRKNLEFSFYYPFLKRPDNPDDIEGFFLKKAFLKQKFKTFLQEAEKNNILFFYGLSGVEICFLLEEWLKKKHRKIVFLEDDLSSFGLLLSHFEASRLLKHKQIEFHLLPKKENSQEFADRLACRFFLEPIDWLSFKKENNNQKTYAYWHACLEEAFIYYSAFMQDRLNFPFLLQNFLKNALKLPFSFDAGKLKNSFLNQPAIICGAGPSLQHDLFHLKEIKDKALILAGGSAIAALSSSGLNPHIGVAVDPNAEESKRLSSVADKTIPLIYASRVHFQVLEMFSGPLGYFKGAYDSTVEAWLKEQIGTSGFYSKDDHKKAVSKENQNILALLDRKAFSVSLSALSLAYFIGCSPIILCGMDLAYNRQGSRYASGVRESFQKEQRKDLGDLFLEKKDKWGKKVKTLKRFVLEEQSFASFVKKVKKLEEKKIKQIKSQTQKKAFRRTEFINATSGGLNISGFAFSPLKEVSKRLKPKDMKIAETLNLLWPSLQKNKEQKTKEKAKIKNSLLLLKKSLGKVAKILEEIIFKIEKKQTDDPVFSLLMLELKAELASELFLDKIGISFELYLKRFEGKNSFLKKMKLLRGVTLDCHKLLACSVESFR